MSIQWRIYCITEDVWVPAWSDTALTVCPNNSEHTINDNSVQEIGTSEQILRINRSVTTSSSNYQRVLRFKYSPTQLSIRKIYAIGYHSGATSFDIQVYDATSLLVLVEYNSTNTDDIGVLDLGTISNNPSVDSVIEVSIKRNGGDNKSIVYLDEIILYS